MGRIPAAHQRTEPWGGWGGGHSPLAVPAASAALIQEGTCVPFHGHLRRGEVLSNPWKRRDIWLIFMLLPPLENSPWIPTRQSKKPKQKQNTRKSLSIKRDTTQPQTKGVLEADSISVRRQLDWAGQTWGWGTGHTSGGFGLARDSLYTLFIPRPIKQAKTVITILGFTSTRSSGRAYTRAPILLAIDTAYLGRGEA